MKTLHEKAAELSVIDDEIRSFLTKSKTESVTEAELTAFEGKRDQKKALEAEVERLKKVADVERELAAKDAVASNQAPANSYVGLSATMNPAAGGSANPVSSLNFDVPAVAKMRKPDLIMRTQGIGVEEAYKQMYALGQWYFATMFGSTKAADWCSKNGFPLIKAQAENINPAGGFLVPTPLAPSIITLAEEFGVVRKLFRREPMTSDTLKIGRTASIINAYWLSDGQTITPTTQNYDMVTLTANKLAAFILRGSEVSEDAIIDFAQELARRIGWIFAYQEDAAGILGNGEPTYGGFNGIINRLTSTFGTSGGAGTSTGGLHTGATNSGTSWSSLTLDDFTATMGLLPQFAWTMGEPTWLVSRQFYYQVMLSLLGAGGGNTFQSLAAGPDGKVRFLGSPVEFSQVMPTKAAANQVCALFGNYSLGAAFGDRKELTIAQSTEFAFSTDQVAIRGIERVGLNVHDVGGANGASQSANPANAQDGTTAVAGPIVGLVTYSS